MNNQHHNYFDPNNINLGVNQQMSNNQFIPNQHYQPITHPTPMQNMYNARSPNMNYVQQNNNYNPEEKQKVNNILHEMLNNLNKRKRNIDLESKANNYILLYSLEPNFRHETCNIIRNVYNKNDIQENQVNKETIVHLLTNNFSEMEILYNKYKM